MLRNMVEDKNISVVGGGNFFINKYRKHIKHLKNVLTLHISA